MNSLTPFDDLSLLASYPLNESSGFAVADVLGNGDGVYEPDDGVDWTGGTLSHSTMPAKESLGYARIDAGASNKITLPTLTIPRRGFLTIWLRTSELDTTSSGQNNDRKIVALKDGGNALSVLTAYGNINFGVTDGITTMGRRTFLSGSNATGLWPPMNDSWHKFGFSWDLDIGATSIKICRDGQSVTSTGGAAPSFLGSDGGEIGGTYSKELDVSRFRLYSGSIATGDRYNEYTYDLIFDLNPELVVPVTTLEEMSGIMQNLTGTVTSAPTGNSNDLAITLDAGNGTIGSHLVGYRLAITGGDNRLAADIVDVASGHGTSAGTVTLSDAIGTNGSDDLPAAGNTVKLVRSVTPSAFDVARKATAV